jgi:hypothetical protein
MFSAAALRRQLLCNMLFVQLVFYPWSPWNGKQLAKEARWN